MLRTVHSDDKEKALSLCIVLSHLDSNKKVLLLTVAPNERIDILSIPQILTVGKYELPPPTKVPLYEHQKKAYAFALENSYVSLLMEQGTGKTLSAIATIGARYLQEDIDNVLIVTPTSILSVWEKEFQKFADFPYELRVLRGTKAKRLEMLTEWKTDKLKVAVINYESVWRMENALLKWKPRTIVLDESHRIKSHTSKQSKELHKLGKLAYYRMILTGTPVSNSPLEFFSQYKFLEPNIFGGNYRKFLHRYAVMGGYGGYQVVQYINLDELTEKAHSIAYRVRKEEAVDLPETVDQTIYCELEPSAKKIYTKLEKEFIADVENNDEISAPNVLTRLLRLSQIVGGFVNTDDGQIINISRSKIKALHEQMNDLLDAGKKVVIFARFKAELDAITEMLNTNKINHVRIDGSVKHRGTLVDRFQNDPECKVFLGQLKAVREGLTLTSADTAIFYSYDYSYADYAQAKSRIHRISQINKCTYIHLVMEKTVDTTILNALHNKKNMADLILDRWKTLTKGGEHLGKNHSIR